MVETLILLENKNQAEEYINKKDDFKKVLPITFDFKSENILSKNKINFKTEEDYEKNNMFRGIHKEAKRITKNIFSEFHIEYRGIEIFSLFYSKIYFRVANMLKYSRILNEIIKKERPKKIFFFKDPDNLFSEVLKGIFEGKLVEIKPPEDKGKRDFKEIVLNLGSKFQNYYVLTNLFLSFKKKKKIFISGGGNYFGSVAEILSKNNKIICFGESLGRGFSVNNRYIPFYRFSGQNNSKEEGFFKKKIDFLIDRINKERIDTKLILENKFKGAIRFILIDLIKNEFFTISKKINEIVYLFNKKRADIILLTEDDTEFSKAIARIAKINKIPTIAFLHGLPVFGDFGKVETDYFVVFGESTKKSFIKNKTRNKEDEKRVMDIGCPWFDKFKPSKKRKNKMILYAMEIAKNEHIMPENHLTKKNQKEVLRWLFDIMKKLPDYHLVLKTRPGWSMEGLPQKIALEKKFKKFTVIEKTNNLDLLNNSQVVIINMSTMGLEAILLKKPVVSVTFKHMDSLNPYKKINFVKKAYTKKQLEKSISEALKTKEKIPSKDINKEILTDGKSTKRTVELINKILCKKSIKL